MKKIIILTLVLAHTFLFVSCKRDGGKSLNVKIMETTQSTVRFRPVCPECDTVGESRVEILYKGEGDVFEDVHVCESCYHIFNIGVTRE